MVFAWGFSTRNTSGIASSDTSNTVSVQLPPSEVAFISTITSFEERYGNAANEYQQSDLREERAEALAAMLPGLSVENWVGQISSMTTTSDGNGTLSVVLLGSQIMVETNNNSLTEAVGSTPTFILHGSPLYDDMANLSQRDTVFFSGSFIPSGLLGNQLDYITELSLTEDGSMTKPDFLFRFAYVGKQPSTLAEKPTPYGGSEEQGVESTMPQQSSQPADVTPAPVASPASASAQGGCTFTDENGKTLTWPNCQPPTNTKNPTQSFPYPGDTPAPQPVVPPDNTVPPSSPDNQQPPAPIERRPPDNQRL